MTTPKPGARVRITGILPDDPAPLAIGEEGTVSRVFNEGSPFEQYSIAWDSGRSLLLLPGDPFAIVAPEPAKRWHLQGTGPEPYTGPPLCDKHYNPPGCLACAEKDAETC